MNEPLSLDEIAEKLEDLENFSSQICGVGKLLYDSGISQNFSSSENHIVDSLHLLFTLQRQLADNLGTLSVQLNRAAMTARKV